MFGRRKKNPSETRENPDEIGETIKAIDPRTEAMLGAIAEQEKTDPLVRAKITSKDLTQNLIQILTDEKGVRVETLLGILGTMAGFTASYAMLHAIASGDLEVEHPEVTIVTTRTGENVMFGNYINRKLAEGEEIGGQHISIWAMVAGKLQQIGTPVDLDLLELFSHVSSRVGQPDFGTVRVIDKHHPGDTPANFVEHLFPALQEILGRYSLPVDQYFLAFALSIQDILEQGKAALAPDIACRIVMESAVNASKIDPTPHLLR